MGADRLISHLEEHRQYLPSTREIVEFSSLPDVVLQQLFLLLPDYIQAKYRAELRIPIEDRPPGNVMEGGVRPD